MQTLNSVNIGSDHALLLCKLRLNKGTTYKVNKLWVIKKINKDSTKSNKVPR